MNFKLVKNLHKNAPADLLFWLICITALLSRSIYILEIDASPLFTFPVVDGKTYVLHAASLARGNWLGLGQGPFGNPPFIRMY